jgi:protein gp37
VRFISAEPLLGPLLYDTDIGMFNDCSCGGQCDHPKREGDPYTPCWSDTYEGPELDLTGIDWLIAGGESGHGARHCDLEWLRALRDACADAGTAFFLKQLGGHPDKRGGDQALLDGARHLAMPRPAVAA